MPFTRRSVLSALAATAATATFRSRLAEAQSPDAAPLHDPLRPAFHYLPERNWINDPCAPVFFRGQYHLFHQYNPHAAVWGDMHWAHAVSPDMVHWQRLPVALAPTTGGPDSEGVFTGSALFQGGKPAVIYTGVQSVSHDQATLSDGTHNFRETQLLATTSDPALRSWTKHPEPVIPSPPPGMKVTGFRDPAPFEFAGRQYLAVGSGQRGVGGMALLYRARKLPNGLADLTQWEYLHPLAQDTTFSRVPPPDTANPTKSTPVDTPKDPVDTGEMWECPDFFALDGRHVLIYSTRRITFWQVGDLDPATLTFHATATGQLDYGRSFYAPKTQLDGHGNRILWGWLAETRPEAELAAAGWAGMISLPRVLTIRNGHLVMFPLPGLQQLRHTSIDGRVQEFTATLEETHDGNVAPPYLLSDANGPLFAIQNGDTSIGGFRTEGMPVSMIRPPMQLPDRSSLQVFFDNSVVEVFLNGQFCHTYRFYSRSRKAPVLTLLLPSSRVLNPRSYALQSIWPV